MKINDNMKKQKYEAPVLTVVEFKTERGFADSNPIKEWTGWSIEQELYLVNGAGNMQNVTGDMTASTFTSGGNITGGGWATSEEGGWF